MDQWWYTNWYTEGGDWYTEPVWMLKIALRAGFQQYFDKLRGIHADSPWSLWSERR